MGYESTQGAQEVLTGWWHNWYWGLVVIIGASFRSHLVEMPRLTYRGQCAMVDMLLPTAVFALYKFQIIYQLYKFKTINHCKKIL